LNFFLRLWIGSGLARQQTREMGGREQLTRSIDFISENYFSEEIYI